jgi:hypothetical protein
MKKVLVVVLFLMLNTLANAQTKKDMLCIKWTIDVEAFMDSMPDEVKAMMEVMPEEQKQAFDLQMEEMKAVYVKFNTNGTMEMFSNDSGAETGTWEFTNEGKSIRTVEGNGGKVTVLDILDISRDFLVLKEQGKENDPALRMIPVVE